MPVRAHQHEAALVERGDIGLVDRDLRQRQAARGGGGGNGPRIGRAEAQQHEAAAVEIERRAPVPQERMRRARAGPARRHVSAGLVRRRRRAVGPHDRRGIVAVSERDPVRDILLGLGADDGVADLAAQALALRRRRGDLVPLGALGEALGVARRLVDVALRHGLPLDLVAVEERRSAPAFDHRRELPAEIDRIAHARVHAEPAGRAVLVDGVAGEQHVAPLPAIGDDAAAGPGQRGDDFVRDAGADEPAHDAVDIDVVPAARARAPGSSPSRHSSLPSSSIKVGWRSSGSTNM